jgi:hypothetical protein
VVEPEGITGERHRDDGALADNEAWWRPIAGQSYDGRGLGLGGWKPIRGEAELGFRAGHRKVSAGPAHG